MESLVEYAKKVRNAYEEYIKENDLDNLAERVYNSIQSIKSLNKSDKNFLDKFIADYTSVVRHLADVMYVGEGGEIATFTSLIRMRPIKLSKTDGRIYEARGNSFDFILQSSNNRKSIKVFQKSKINF